MTTKFRIYVPQTVVTAFQDPNTYAVLGSPTRYIFQQKQHY